MTRYYSNSPFERINYMTFEQQAQIIKLIQEIDAADRLTIPRVILSIDDDNCWMRSKNDVQRHISRLGTSPIKTFVEYMRTEQKLLIGEPTAQKVIEDIGSVLPLPQERTFSVKGRSMESGLPAAIEISSVQVREVLLSKVFNEGFANNLNHFFTYLPSSHQISYEQIAQAQIILRGSLPAIKGFDAYLHTLTGLKVVWEWG